MKKRFLCMTAVWCGLCQMLSPYLERMALLFKDEGIVILSADCDENKELASSLGAGPIPDIRIYKNGHPWGILLGFDPLSTYIKIKSAAAK